MTKIVQTRRDTFMGRLWAVVGPAFERAARDNFGRPWTDMPRKSC